MGNGQASFGKWLLLSGIIPLSLFFNLWLFPFSYNFITLDAKLTQHFFVCPGFSPILLGQREEYAANTMLFPNSMLYVL